MLEYAEALVPDATRSGGVLQQLYDHVLAKPEIEAELIEAVGLALGAQIVAASGFEWVWTDGDDYLPEIAVGVPRLKLVCHPVSMIAKRLSDREAWDLGDLVIGTVERMRTLVDEAVARRGH
jgi:hypothetical protein